MANIGDFEGFPLGVYLKNKMESVLEKCTFLFKRIRIHSTQYDKPGFLIIIVFHVPDLFFLPVTEYSF